VTELQALIHYPRVPFVVALHWMKQLLPLNGFPICLLWCYNVTLPQKIR